MAAFMSSVSWVLRDMGCSGEVAADHGSALRKRRRPATRGVPAFGNAMGARPGPRRPQYIRWRLVTSRELRRAWRFRSEEHTSELQSLMRISYAVFCLKKKNNTKRRLQYNDTTTISTPHS